MIDPLKETLISLREAAQIFPRRRRGQKPHVGTLYRYANPGYHGIVLETVRAGQLATSREAVARFILAMTEADRGGARRTAATVSPAGTASFAGVSAVERELDAEGLSSRPGGAA